MKRLLAPFAAASLLGVVTSLSLPAHCAALPAAAPDPTANISPFGVNFLKWEFLKKEADPIGDLRQRIAIMKGAGIYWDRDGIDRRTVHPGPGQWDWTYTDKVVALCKAEGIHLAVILMGGGPPRDAADRADYAEYVYRTVDRYKDSINVWEIWNEPNIPSFWKNPDAALYTAMLKAAYTAAKRADPNCMVLGGSANGPGGDWFNAIAANGGWDYCDAVSMHPYAMSPNPLKQRFDLILRTLNGVVASHGKKPVWITEDGWRAGPDPTSEANQAVDVVQIYVIALANGIRNFDYFCLDDYDHWGLIRSHQPFVPKPSYRALKRLIATLAPVPDGPAARFEGYLRLPAGVAGYVFARPGQERVLILWSLDEKEHPVALPQRDGLRAVDLFGSPVPVAGGRLTVGKAPLIVTGDAARLGPVSPAANPNILPPGTNLIFNGALNAEKDPAEEGDYNDPGAWHRGVFNAGGKDAAFVTAPDGPDGSISVSIARSTGKAAWYSEIVPVEPGKRYRLTAHLRTQDATGENAAAITWYSGNMWTPLGWVKTPNQTGTSGWTEVTAEAIAPRDATFMRVHLLGSDNHGAVWFGDISLVEE